MPYISDNLYGERTTKIKVRVEGLSNSADWYGYVNFVIVGLGRPHKTSNQFYNSGRSGYVEFANLDPDTYTIEAQVYSRTGAAAGSRMSKSITIKAKDDEGEGGGEGGGEGEGEGEDGNGTLPTPRLSYSPSTDNCIITWSAPSGADDLRYKIWPSSSPEPSTYSVTSAYRDILIAKNLKPGTTYSLKAYYFTQLPDKYLMSDEIYSRSAFTTVSNSLDTFDFTDSNNGVDFVAGDPIKTLTAKNWNELMHCIQDAIAKVTSDNWTPPVVNPGDPLTAARYNKAVSGLNLLPEGSDLDLVEPGDRITAARINILRIKYNNNR